MQKIYLALKAVIFKGRRILILRRSSTEDVFKEEWDIPGGKIKFGEEPEKALQREIKEETGIKVKIIRPVRIWTFFKENRKTQVIGITLLCRYSGGKIKLSKEHDDYKWIKPEDIGKYKIHEGIKKDVKEALKR
ncbi:MAG: NUDIX domain-containing protein [Candidatus Parvarchaeota archaeon]|nr:NUDIX domain-containing protein [Candidatus Jingweiarchaeum tengchongense]MCW1297698.1 NUDIX domain-containing protein [Candidatus Jingweiarchaeum tengchongense]MCW1299709.1 NUDIX domain-containing protein [Candidatus Jingweiarchaeum tengchongense]MCW1304323.1 NUDIX domain-containing protein [Candidatus Jingweiarchaeum tengchongense]MCW1305694.1 NUDIX domain-containing protein [Candidatus Jingweiarchaeum tengchongense]